MPRFKDVLTKGNVAKVILVWLICTCMIVVSTVTELSRGAQTGVICFMMFIMAVAAYYPVSIYIRLLEEQIRLSKLKK